MRTTTYTHDNTSDGLKFLSETAMAFTSDTINKNIYEYICQCLKRLYPDAIILVNSVDHDNGLSKNEALDIGKWSMDQIISLIKFNPKGKAYKYDDSINELIHGTITKFNGGLHELSFKTIPKKLAQITERVLDIGNIYGIAFMVDEKIYALAIILLPQGHELTHAETLETFARQASVTLKRIVAEKREAKYRSLINAIPDMMFRLNSRGEFLEYKAEGGDLYYQAADIIGKTSRELLPADVASLIEGKIHDTLQTGAIQVFEYRLNVPDKGLQDYEARMIPHGSHEVITIVRNITDKKNNLRLVAESEANARAIMESTTNVIILIDKDFRVIDTNESHANRFGMTRKEMIGKTIMDFLPSNVTESRKKYLEQVLQSGQPCFFEDERGGYWNEVSILPVVNTAGDVDRVAVFVQDITDRKKKEEELRVSEKKYQMLADSFPEVFFAFDKELRYTYWNTASEKLTGIKAEQAIGKSLDELFLNTPGFEHIEQFYQKVLDTGKCHTKEFKTKLDGKPYYFEISACPIVDGLSVFAKNITKRKESEQRILESETNLKAIIENSLDSIWMINPDLKIEYVNKRFVDEFYKCFGVKLAKGVMIIDKMPPAMQALWRERYEKVFQNQHMFFEDKIEDEDNITFIEVAMQPVVMDGKVSGITFSGRDISLRRLAEESLKKSAAELRQLNASKDRFFSIIAHDLRSPFNSILGLSNYLMEEASNMDVKEIEKSAAVIYESASQTMQLLENLLSWARMQQGRIPYEPQNLLLHELAASTISFISDQAEQKNIRLLNEVPEDLIARADADMLQTILRNLVSNAVKFTRSGGQVQLSAKTVENHIHFLVRDNGIGISAENIKLIFDVTTNYTKRGTANEKGTGLGLLVCKEFVEKHGGRIWAESEEGKGSVFGFALPGRSDAAQVSTKKSNMNL